MAYAPRLLYGYLLEAGRDGIRLKRSRAGSESPSMDLATRLFDHLPERCMLEETRRALKNDGWPAGLRRVNLRNASRQIIGHGLLMGSRPVHLALFGE